MTLGLKVTYSPFPPNPTCIHILTELPIIVFNDNSFSDCRVLSCGQTDGQDGTFLCQRSNCYLRPQHDIHSTVRNSANEHRQGRNQRDTAVYMTGRVTEDFRFPVRSTMLGNSRLEYAK